MIAASSWKVWCVTDVIKRVKARLGQRRKTSIWPQSPDRRSTRGKIFWDTLFLLVLAGLRRLATFCLLWRPLVVLSFETCELHKRTTAPSAGRRIVNFKGRIESYILSILHIYKNKSASLHHWVHWWVPVFPAPACEKPQRHFICMSHCCRTHFAVWVISQPRWAPESAPSANRDSMSAVCEVCARREFPVSWPRAKVTLWWHVEVWVCLWTREIVRLPSTPTCGHCIANEKLQMKFGWEDGFTLQAYLGLCCAVAADSSDCEPHLHNSGEKPLHWAWAEGKTKFIQGN